jgi:hypothetical protein
MDKDSVTRWLERYINAWRTYDPQAIGDLFTKDATYAYHPWDKEPVKGRDAIVSNWLESPDAPGSWSAEYEAYTVEGDRAVVVGWTRYLSGDRTTVDRTFYNVWLLRFDTSGRCSEFVETYMETPKEAV